MNCFPLLFQHYNPGYMTISMIRNLATLFVFSPEVLEAETSSTYNQEKNVSTAQK